MTGLKEYYGKCLQIIQLSWIMGAISLRKVEGRLWILNSRRQKFVIWPFFAYCFFDHATSELDLSKNICINYTPTIFCADCAAELRQHILWSLVKL